MSIHSKNVFAFFNVLLLKPSVLTVTSEEIFILHAIAFGTFCLTSLLSMALVLYVIRDTRNARFKRNLLRLSVLCVCGAVFFFHRHNEKCEPYVYTMFAVCEYTVVAANMVWNSNIVKQFTGYDLVMEPSLEIK